MITSRVVLVGKIPSTTWKISSQDGRLEVVFLRFENPMNFGHLEGEPGNNRYLGGRKLTKVILTTYIHWADPPSRV